MRIAAGIRAWAITNCGRRVFTQGSPYNVPAGHYVNLDKVVAHYRKKHLDEEERKAKKIAAANKEE